MPYGRFSVARSPRTPLRLIESLHTAIVDDDLATVRRLLKAEPDLAHYLNAKAKLYNSSILHWLYVGDTPLHLAAAGHRDEIVGLLLAAGAEPNAATNHRHSTPLHYAADGYVSGPTWDADRQVKTIRRLLDAGADVGAKDKNGAMPLHRAVRTRCAAAVRVLLSAGADPKARNNPGSTAFHLAVQDTGRGGSGSDVARAGQREILQMFLDLGMISTIKDAKGKSVLQSARSAWVREMLQRGR
jgi:ankyrin repeat protein